MLQLPADDPHYAEMSATDQQLSFLEAIDDPELLERLEGATPHPAEGWAW